MKDKGFTLIELMVVIALIGMLSSFILASLTNAKMKGQNARRITDLQNMQIALEYYLDKYHVYPSSDYGGNGGWDTPGNGTFITPLVNEGYIQHMSDPVVNDFNGNYRYYRYPPGYAGCDASRGGFYILGVVDMAGNTGPYPGSPGWRCPSRNWQAEFEWVIGKFEK